MLLSIVMMVKNEDKVLEKTLCSLDKLRTKIDSELIILDTGSTDKTVDISKRYTDKVYFEKWNDDFSSMRNKSISYAKGQWILIIDADEILLDCSRLIKFFKSNEKNIYNCGTIRIKNLYTSDKKQFGYCSIPRLFRREGFKYEGIIHEQPLCKNPIYNDVIEVEHYGYLFEDESFRINKVRRNEKLLLKQLEENPNDPYANYQMGKNFVGEGNYIDAKYYFEKSFKLYKEIGILPEYMYINLAKTYVVLGKFEECEKICKSYVKKDKNNIDIYYYLGQSQIALNNIKNGMESLQRYVFLVENYEISTQANSMFSDGETVNLRDDAIVSIIRCMKYFKKYNDVLENYNKISSIEKKSSCYLDILESLYELNLFDNIFKYYNEVKDIYSEKIKLYNCLEIFLNSIKSDDRQYLYKIMSKFDDNYGFLNRIRIKNYVDLNTCKSILAEEKEVIYGSILDIAIESNIDLYDIFKDIDSIWIESYIGYVVKYNRKILIKLYDYIASVPNTFDFNRIRVYRIISRVVLSSNSLSDNKYFELFYIDNMYSYQYLKYIYKDFSDTDILKILNNNYDRFSIEFRILIQCELKINEKIEKLKYLIKEYPYYKKIIEKLVKDLKKDLFETVEFKKLKQQFFENIIDMVNNNELSNARKMLDEYCSNFGSDSKILNIKGVVKFIEGDINGADSMFKKSLSMNLYDEDTLYNINNICL